jgi:hypothetical protein
MDEYDLVTTEEGSLGGGIGTPFEGVDKLVIFYIQVPSIDEALASIESAGGETVRERTEIPGMVTYGQFRDPAGNIIGLVEPGMPQ